MAHVESGLVQRAADGPRDLFDGKLRVPGVRPGSVSRTPLVNRLRAGLSRPVMTVLAPAGYGKTTVLAQWAERDRRPFAWVSLGEEHNDPVVLARDVASVLSHVAPMDAPGVLMSAGGPGPHGLPRLVAALASAPHPLVLVLDDVHVLRTRKSIALVAALTEHVLDESTLVLAGRTLPRLPIGRLRVAGRLFEVGVAELALDHREVGLVARSVGLALEQADVVELAIRTEGWAAGTYLAALTLKDDLRAGAMQPTGGGGDRFHVDYLDYEHLSRLRSSDVLFLTRTAVLDRMCGPLCDAMLESSGSAARLESLARSNLFVVRLDAQRSWYRYHRGFRDFLRAELGQREPEAVEELHRRAAAWCESNGEPEAGIAHARAAGEVERLSRLVTRLVLPVCSAGRVDTVESWLEWFDEALRLEQHPTVGVLGAWVHSLSGRPSAAKRWLAAACRGTTDGILPDGSRTLEPWCSVVRAAMCGNGAKRMRSDAEIAVRGLGPSSAWRPTALLMLGIAQLLVDDSEADETLADAIEAAAEAGATDVWMLALVERSLLAASRANDAEAESLVAQARTVLDDAPMCRHPLSALVYAASARHALRHGDLAQARADRTKALDFAPLGRALPWYSVQTSLELARVDLALLDPPAARTWISAAGEILSRRPLLGALGAQADALRDEASRVAALSDDQPTTISAAELRLLPLLTTHLSFREIGERLGVTRSTVKTQAISMYRKLGVSSRSEAIERAVELGLVDGASELRPVEFIPSG